SSSSSSKLSPSVLSYLEGVLMVLLPLPVVDGMDSVTSVMGVMNGNFLFSFSTGSSHGRVGGSKSAGGGPMIRPSLSVRGVGASSSLLPSYLIGVLMVL